VHPVDQPRLFGIAFLKADGSLEKLVEKPDLDGRQLANTGAYLFPQTVFGTELKVSSRGEYEITDYVSALAREQTVAAVEAKFWLPMGTAEVWQAAQQMDLSPLNKGDSSQ
jgi:dTDP-glucose pyrophosphorylase